jgi:hypothetical protein
MSRMTEREMAEALTTATCIASMTILFAVRNVDEYAEFLDEMGAAGILAAAPNGTPDAVMGDSYTPTPRESLLHDLTMAGAMFGGASAEARAATAHYEQAELDDLEAMLRD